MHYAQYPHAYVKSLGIGVSRLVSTVVSSTVRRQTCGCVMRYRIWRVGWVCIYNCRYITR